MELSIEMISNHTSGFALDCIDSALEGEGVLSSSKKVRADTTEILPLRKFVQLVPRPKKC